MKQIKEIGDKDINFPVFDTSKILTKPNNNWFNINNPPLFDKIQTLDNFRSDIKLFNEIPKPRINFNIEKPPDNNLEQKSENGNNQKYKNEFSLNLENNNLEKKNENQIENCLNNIEIKMPNFPSFFNDNKDNFNKNKNMENPINTSMNYLKIGNVNLNNNPTKNNNRFDMILNCIKQPPSLINNICNNYMSGYKLALDNFLFHSTFGTLPPNTSLNSNLIINSFNNKLNYFPFNMTETNNKINKNRIDNDLLGNKRI